MQQPPPYARAPPPHASRTSPLPPGARGAPGAPGRGPAHAAATQPPPHQGLRPVGPGAGAGLATPASRSPVPPGARSPVPAPVPGSGSVPAPAGGRSPIGRPINMGPPPVQPHPHARPPSAAAAAAAGQPISRPPSATPFARPPSAAPLGAGPGGRPMPGPGHPPIARPPSAAPIHRPPSAAPIARPPSAAPLGRPSSAAPLGAAAGVHPSPQQARMASPSGPPSAQRSPVRPTGAVRALGPSPVPPMAAATGGLSARPVMSPPVTGAGVSPGQMPLRPLGPPVPAAAATPPPGVRPTPVVAAPLNNGAGAAVPSAPVIPPGARNPALRPSAPTRKGHNTMQSIDIGVSGIDLNNNHQHQGGFGGTGPHKPNKRSARAYHTDAAPAAVPPEGAAMPATAAVGPGGAGAGAAAPSAGQAWQQEAAARAAASGMEAWLAGESDAAMDQLPGQRNLISQRHAAYNQAAVAGAPNYHPDINGTSGMAGPAGATQAPRPKINPDMIPAPVATHDEDQEFFDKEWFGTCSRTMLPLSTTDFAAVDQGNANPKFMRLSTYNVPATDELATQAKFPLSLVVQPLAQLRQDESHVPVIAATDKGPPRCKRCRAYVNPWFVFIEGGQKMVCNLCGQASEVPPEYFCNLDMNGRRADIDVRPELHFGTVDFEVPTEYWAIQAKLPSETLLPAPELPLPASASAQLPPTQPKEATGTTLGMSGGVGAAAKAATKTASGALNNLNSFALGGDGSGPRTVVRVPKPLNYFFALDVSFSAVRSGALKEAVKGIRECLYGPPAAYETENGNGTIKPTDADVCDPPANQQAANAGFGLPHGSRVAILTFDRALHFWNLHPTLDSAQMLVVGDVDEPFVPLSSGLLVDPWDSRHVVESLLESLPDYFAESMVAEACLGSAVRSAQACLSAVGGKLSVFLSTIPTVGPGKLKHREDTKLYGTPEEKKLFVTADPFWRSTGEELADAGIGVDVYFFPAQYIDVASVGILSGLTGGEVFFHPRFDATRDAVRLRAQLQRTLLRETGYNVSLRVRASNGLYIKDYLGNFSQHNVTDIELGTVDADKTFTCLIKHDGKLDDKQEAHFQCAMLYTTATGQRRVRSLNLAVPITNQLGNVFRYAHMDAVVAYYMKESALLALTKPLKQVRQYLTKKCVQILLAYRTHCASATSPGQLILPESFKLLPLYTLGMLKTKVLKGGNVTSDVRAVSMRTLLSQSVGRIMLQLYPRLIALHKMTEADGLPIKVADDQGVEHEGWRIKIPALVRPSFARLDAHGAYLLDNGDVVLLWIGADAQPKLLEDLWGVSNLDQVDPRTTSLPEVSSRLSNQVRNLVRCFAQQRGKATLAVCVARQGRDGSEVEFASQLVEDVNNDAMNYVDYLCTVHRKISQEVSGEGTNKDEDDAVTSSIWKGW